VAELFWPVRGEKVPQGHSSHWTLPASGEYLPAGQGAQVDAFSAASEAEKVPAGQSSHVSELFWPVRGENVPRGHALHSQAE
jgi:hypothetical protein